MRMYKQFRSATNKEDLLRTYYGGSCTTVLAHHVSLLLGMLKDQVLHHSFIKATATLETIAMAMDQVPDVMRNVGVGILSCDLHGYKLTIQMLKHMFTWQPKHRVQLLIETAVFLVCHGNVQEAYDTLQSQIHGEPFKSDILVHGYCGLLKYMTWKEEVELDDSGGVAEEVGLDGEGGVAGKGKSLIKQALQHFHDMEELDMPSTTLFSIVDTFILTHSKLLLRVGQTEKALQVLVSYTEKNPGNLNAHRSVCQFLKEQEQDEECLIPHLRKLVKLDDSSPEAVELADILCRGNDSNYLGEVFEVLVRYLDYPSNRSDTLAWDILHQVQNKWPQYTESDLWIQRLKWWGNLQQPPT